MKAGTLRIISLLTLAAIWELAGRNGNAHLLPPLSKVITVWLELLVSGQLFQAIAVSFQALAIGFFISVLFGVPLGFGLSAARLTDMLSAAAGLGVVPSESARICGTSSRSRAARKRRDVAPVLSQRTL